jgi:signal transduction histidine kinase
MLSKLRPHSVSLRLLLPILVTFLSLWTVGTVAFGYFASNRLELAARKELEDTVRFLEDALQQRRSTLNLKARAISIDRAVVAATAKGDRAALFRTMKPIQVALELDWMAIFNLQGELLLSLQEGALSSIRLSDRAAVSRASRAALEVSGILPAQTASPSALVELQRIKSDQKTFAGLVVGMAVDDALLQEIRRDTSMHVVAFEGDQVTAATLPIDRHQSLSFPPRDLAKILQSMNVGSVRIRDIVLSLRNFSRLDEAEYKLVNLHEGLDNTLMILRHRLTGNPELPVVEVVKHYGQLPLVKCYPGHLNQVFMNLLANAIDALEAASQSSRSPVITISTNVVADRQVQITIADNGVGISEAVRPQIFDPFFTTKPIGKGTGLGLSISYQIVTDRHHGKMWCESTPDAGSKFVIAIPMGK